MLSAKTPHTQKHKWGFVGVMDTSWSFTTPASSNTKGQHPQLS